MFVLASEQYAILVRMDPVENSVVAALGNTHEDHSWRGTFKMPQALLLSGIWIVNVQTYYNDKKNILSLSYSDKRR